MKFSPESNTGPANNFSRQESAGNANEISAEEFTKIGDLVGRVAIKEGYVRPTEEDKELNISNEPWLNEVKALIDRGPEHEAAFFSMLFESMYDIAGENRAVSIKHISEDLGYTSSKIGQLFAAYISQAREYKPNY